MKLSKMMCDFYVLFIYLFILYNEPFLTNLTELSMNVCINLTDYSLNLNMFLPKFINVNNVNILCTNY
jgi:hypothetical protein